MNKQTEFIADVEAQQNRIEEFRQLIEDNEQTEKEADNDLLERSERRLVLLMEFIEDEPQEWTPLLSILGWCKTDIDKVYADNNGWISKV